MEDNKERGNSTLAFKAGFWYVCGTFVGKAVAFITTPIFARLMTTSDFGEFSNFANWVVLLTFIVGAELHSTLSRAYYDFIDYYDEYISSITILGIFITVSTYIIVCVSRGIFFKIVTIPQQYVHILFFFLLFYYCRLVYYARERTLYRYKTVAVVTFCSLFVPTIISIIVVFFLPETNHLSARIYGFYFPSALIGLFCAISLFKKGFVIKWRYCRYALFLSIPLLVHHLTSYLLTSTNVIITKNSSGAEAAAIVSIAISTINILVMLSQATAGALTTWLMDNLELRKTGIIRKGTLLYVLFLSAIVVGVISFSPEIIYLVGGPKYVDAVSLLPGLVFATFIQSVTTIFTIILTYDKNIVKNAVYTCFFALLSIALKVWLMPDYGLMTLIYVNIVVFCLLFFINYYLVRQAGYKNVVFFKGILVVIFVIGFFAFISSFLYNFQGIRFVFIGLVAAFGIALLVLNRKKVMLIIQSIKNKTCEK